MSKVFLLIAASLVLSGCNYQISDGRISAYQQYCEGRGGIDEVTLNVPFATYRVKCNDQSVTSHIKVVQQLSQEKDK